MIAHGENVVNSGNENIDSCADQSENTGNTVLIFLFYRSFCRSGRFFINHILRHVKTTGTAMLIIIGAYCTTLRTLLHKLFPPHLKQCLINTKDYPERSS